MAITNAGTDDGTNVSTLTITGVTAAVGDVIAVLVGGLDLYTSDQVSSIAWSGESFTVARAFRPPNDVEDWNDVEIWYLVVAGADTASITINFTGAMGNIGGGVAAVAVVMTDMNVGDLVGDFAELYSGGQSPPNGHHDVTVDTAAGDIVLSVMSAGTGTGDSFAPQSGQTELYNGFATFGHTLMCASYKVAAGASTTVGYDFTNQIALAESNNNAHLAVVFKPSGGGGGGGGGRIILPDHYKNGRFQLKNGNFRN